MDETFELSVLYKEKELLFTTKLLRLGYIYKFLVNINGTDVFFEQDDEANYSALVDPVKLDEGVKINVGLLEAVAISLENIL